MASWFYLTLWRGNPPELTDHLQLEIATTDPAAAGVTATSHTEAAIGTEDRHGSGVCTTVPVAAGITALSEADAAIDAADQHEIGIQTTYRAAAGITAASRADADIGAADQHEIGIITKDHIDGSVERKTEVTWYVGKDH